MFVDGGGHGVHGPQGGAEFVERAEQVALDGSVWTDAGDGFLNGGEGVAHVLGEIGEFLGIHEPTGGSAGFLDFLQSCATLGDGDGSLICGDAEFSHGLIEWQSLQLVENGGEFCFQLGKSGGNRRDGGKIADFGELCGCGAFVVVQIHEKCASEDTANFQGRTKAAVDLATEILGICMIDALDGSETQQERIDFYQHGDP